MKGMICMAKKKSTKKISAKNYVYSFLILVGGILLAWYFFSWYQVKKEERLMTSYLVKTSTVESSITDLVSLNQFITEAPSSYFIFIGYTNDQKVYSYEKDLKVLIDKYKLNDIFYYVDITNMMNANSNYIEELNHVLQINLESVPAIIYVNEGSINKKDILYNLSVKDFKKLLNKYDYQVVK